MCTEERKKSLEASYCIQESSKEELDRGTISLFSAEFLDRGFKPQETIEIIVELGATKSLTRICVQELVEAKRDVNEHAQKDIMYGILWCIGGSVLSLTEVGFIFLGAIIFGGLQFIKGLLSLNNTTSYVDLIEKVSQLSTDSS